MSLFIENYTKQNELEFDDSTELETYLEENEGDEIGVSLCQTIAINSLEEAIIYLDIDEDKKDLIKIASECGGYSYFKTIEEALSYVDREVIYDFIGGATSAYRVAEELDTNIMYDDILLRILGCSSEAYAELGRFVTRDDIAHILDVEYNTVYTDNGAYIIIAQ